MDLAEEIADLICGRVLDDNLEIGRLDAAHFMERQFRKVVFSTPDCWSTNLQQQDFQEQAHRNSAEIIALDFITHNPENKKKFYVRRDWLAQRRIETNWPLGVMAITVFRRGQRVKNEWPAWNRPLSH